ncbi:hypothetical protein B5G52_04175 [Pseudoalteromonas sp. A601]|uniref:hypothetical protein n=1 Tax=Pseudoalteromonas sp. A601 TaxID=1967839 RepID=UPI000B3BECE9|nr:hypothetical protein [Pseudoalteromonas sp. A601]OUS73450.1 hypothetical protein B5G52_04175 [Pseudoalteromonas sp. A601]
MQLELSNRLFKDLMKFANRENLSVKSKIAHLLESYVQEMKTNEDCQEGINNGDTINDQFEGIGETSAH